MLIVLAILLFWCRVAIVCEWSNAALSRENAAAVRCTRRFSVGVCPEHVQPVWTYVPHLQNCTQRLGCPEATVSNRFPTRHECLNTCHALQDLYTLYQASEPNSTNLLRGRWKDIGRSELHGEPIIERTYDYTEATTEDGVELDFQTEDGPTNWLHEALEPDNPDLALWL